MQLGPSTVKWRTVVIALALVAFFAAAFAYVASNESQADTQTDQAHVTLGHARHDYAVDLGHLVIGRADLSTVDGRIGESTVALAKDTAQLKVVRAALAQAEATRADQGGDIDNLQTCLGGVQSALNAISVGDQSHGLAQLIAVATACGTAAASSG